MSMLPAAGMYAVTDQEMEQARTITAKAYLRYANDGSGYLDEVNVKTMADLEKALKPKEVENLKAFKAIKVPADYASWDKTKLVEFWAVTFFSSPELSEKGKIAKSRVRKQVSAMNVQPPTSKPEPAPEATPEASTAADPGQTVVMPDSLPTAAEAIQEQQDILADQQAIAEDARQVKSLDKEQSYTWVYIVILVILICVVIWLVMYAAKVMKRQERREGAEEAFFSGDNGASRAEIAELSTRLAEKSEEINRLTRKLKEAEERNVEASKMLERVQSDNRRLMERMERMREETNHQDAESRHEPKAKYEEPIIEEPKEEPEILKVIYLGRANSRGIFVRADRRVSPGNTIYRLDTEDGIVGTFRVVDLPSVTKLALSSPNEYLAGGCLGKDLGDTAGVTAIVTESAGTAIFENGYWKVLRKSHIRYE